MNLFHFERFTGASGHVLPWKIECDALCDDDWSCIAEIAAKYLPPFGMILGVPNGGLKLASFLEMYADRSSDITAIVDDVWTTGTSMNRYVEKHKIENWFGFVVFARASVSVHVYTLWNFGFINHEN